MNDARVGIVWNPSKTGKEALEAALREAASPEQFASAAWFETTEDDAGQAAASRALEAGVGVVLAAGGDGTIRAVAERLADSGASAALGIIPLGTGNLLARNLEVPLNDLTAAFARALVGPGHPLDIGWAEVTLAHGTERHAFAVMAGFGIDAHMITETDDDLKDKVGWLAYVESLGRAVSASEVVDLRVSLDGGAVQSEQAHTVIVGNCGMLQAGVTLLPDADPRDGELDLLVLHADGIAGWLGTMRNMVWENGLRRLFQGGEGAGGETAAESNETTSRRRLTSLTVELDEPRVVEVDGDDLGEVTRIVISIQPAAITVR